MAKVWFIGDEVSACAWRLAGVHTVTPAPGEEGQALAQALSSQAQLLLMTHAIAAGVAKPSLEKALMGINPLVLVIPDSRQPDAAPDLAALIRARLGLTA